MSSSPQPTRPGTPMSAAATIDTLTNSSHAEDFVAEPSTVQTATDAANSGSSTPLNGTNSQTASNSRRSNGTTKNKDNQGSKANSSSSESASSSLVGRINNLISSDLDNIVEGRQLAYIVIFIPLKIALSVWFLYVILGWRCVYS